MKKTIILAGGGTGGHIWPLIPVAKALAKEFRVVYFGQRKGPEEKIAQQHHLKFEGIRAAKLQGWAVLNPATWISQISGFFQSRALIRKYQPSLVLAKGGFVSFPVALAASFSGVKVILHESDAVIGRANRLLLPIAFRILVGFPKNYYPVLARTKMIRVGIPVRLGFREAPISRSQAILFVGGSQGSQYLNQMVKELAPNLLKRVKVIHICGPKNLSEMKKFQNSLSKKAQRKYRLFGFTNRVPDLIKQSRVIVSRAGATLLAEIGRVGRPVILIPYPYAASTHQKRNAEILVERGAATMLLEQKTKSKRLKKEIDRLLKAKIEQKRLSENLRRFWATEAKEKIVEIIKSLV